MNTTIQIIDDSVGRRHHCTARPVKPADKGIGPAKRQANPRMDIFGQARVIGGGEGQLVAPREPSCRQTQRPFGGNVQMIGPKGAKPRRHAAARKHRKPDFRLGRAGDGPEGFRSDHHHIMAKRLQPFAGFGQGAHHTVDLREPGIGDNGDLQGPALMPGPQVLPASTGQRHAR